MTESSAYTLLRKAFGPVVITGTFLMPICLGSCSRQAEQVSAEEMAEQMEAAKEGREAAKEIVTKNWKDTMDLQLALIDARSKNSKYEIAGKTSCKAKFDSAFFGTIRTVRPDLADQIQP